MVKVTIAGSEFEVQYIDSTHLSLRLHRPSGNPYPPAVYHVAQLGPETTRQLKDLGVMDSHGSMVTPVEDEPDHGFLCGCERCHELKLDAASEPEERF